MNLIEQPFQHDNFQTEDSAPIQDNENNSNFHGLISPKLANELLMKYRMHKMPQYPFVIIPPEIDFVMLRQQSPFLFLCVMTASLEHDPALQHTLETLIRGEIATRLIIKIERNIDLLQGLLVHIAWSHYHWRTYHTHMYMLLQMASSVVVDLDLDRDESFRMQTIPIEGKEPDQIQELSSQTAAGQRALLGCYYISSKSSIFRGQLTMRHTRWVDQCAKSLAEKAEYPTDLQLKAYVDVQSLAYQSRLLFEELRRCSKFPPLEDWTRVSDLIQQQSQIEEPLTLHNTENHSWALRLELSAAHTLVLGQALWRRRDIFELQEINHLKTLTTSAHNIISTFLAVPSSVAVHLPASAYMTIWYGLLVLSKLSLLFHPDESQVTSVDNKRTHERALAVIQKFEELPPGDNVWTNSIKVVRNLLSWLEKMKAEAQRHVPPSSALMSPSTGYRFNRSQGSSFQPSVPVFWQGHLPRVGDNLVKQAAWSPIFSQEDHAASKDIQNGLTDEFDVGQWQQMLDSFTWFGPSSDSQLNFGYYGNVA
ncbi:hypothetical protein BGW36DRAFT_304239 [Talaromyces proteolyticus]|uniref:Transcription factor domain-containing protein n=1 Tax=Talaromyces proteolyticus TaxID=1131652 RepID=A0AAD4KIE6_9EURO|nr:uncharacterized protein BGW36DRAFT_304239 [Talaromyces proteolyticus]KAH8692266.1 hypothetical protein BGW36DRAFT_304239 [Talaromyces proteolyticus]